MSTIPVRYSPNAERLYFGCDEFGQFVAILADTFEEAYEEALCALHDRDGDCDHGIAESELMDSPARMEAQEGCDCSMSDDGPVWDVYLSLTQTDITRDQFEEKFGDECEAIERKNVEALAA